MFLLGACRAVSVLIATGLSAWGKVYLISTLSILLPVTHRPLLS